MENGEGRRWHNVKTFWGWDRGAAGRQPSEDNGGRLSWPEGNSRRKDSEVGRNKTDVFRKCKEGKHHQRWVTEGVVGNSIGQAGRGQMTSGSEGPRKTLGQIFNVRETLVRETIWFTFYKDHSSWLCGGWAVRKARVKAEKLLEVHHCRPERNTWCGQGHSPCMWFEIVWLESQTIYILEIYFNGTNMLAGGGGAVAVWGGKWCNTDAF